jgi:hypothetical protein
MKGLPMKMGKTCVTIPTQREGIKKFLMHGGMRALQTTETLLGLLRERGKRGLPLKRV